MSLTSLYQRYQSVAFPALLFIIGLVFNYPYMDYQDLLSTGDHGRDYYAFAQVLNGERPYKDFWWTYGPLMPYYYALFYKALGAQMLSVLIGKIFIKLAAGLLFYAALTTFTTPVIGFLGALWFWQFHSDFFFTYNHIGAIALTCGVLWSMLTYIRTGYMRPLMLGLAMTLVLCLIKINFGATALACLIGTVILSDILFKHPVNFQKRLFYTLAFIGVPMATIIIYWIFLRDLPFYIIRQCLPYLPGDEPYNVEPFLVSASTALKMFFQGFFGNLKGSFGVKVFTTIVTASILRTVYLAWTGKINSRARKELAIAILMLCVFFIFNWHEFLKTGVWYRSFWSQPFSLMMIFIFIHVALQRLPAWLKGIVFSIVAFIVFGSFFFIQSVVAATKTPAHYLNTPHGKIFVGNDPHWVNTVVTTADYLNKILPKNELFFALPYDPMYYYLTGRKTPTRQTIFFEHIKIRPEQELDVIRDLESKGVDYIVLSNRHASQEQGLGLLGKDYCPTLAQWIDQNFQPVAKFGDWDHHPGWGWYHGTMVLKRMTHNP